MNKTSSLLFVAGMLGYSAATHAITENVIVCETCNYQQARSLALQQASPQLNCVTVGGGDMINIDNQSCTSQPRRIVIFDANSRQVYPFEVYHTNQGFDAFDMQVVTRDTAIHPENLKLLNVGVDMQTNLHNSVDDLSKDLGNIFHQTTQQSAMRDRDLQYLHNVNCDDDKDAAALEAAFNSSKQYEVKPLSSYLTVVFKTNKDLEFFHSKGISDRSGYPQLVYAVEQDKNGKKIARVVEDYSYIDGFSLADFHKMGDVVPLRVSQCVGIKLQDVMPELQFDKPTRDSFGHCVQYGKRDSYIVAIRPATCPTELL